MKMPLETEKSLMMEFVLSMILIVLIVIFVVSSPIITTFGYWIVVIVGLVMIGYSKLAYMERNDRMDTFYNIIWLVLAAVVYYIATSNSLETARLALIGSLILHAVDLLYSVWKYWKVQVKKNSDMYAVGTAMLGNLLAFANNAYILTF